MFSRGCGLHYCPLQKFNQRTLRWSTVFNGNGNKHGLEEDSPVPGAAALSTEMMMRRRRSWSDWGQGNSLLLPPPRKLLFSHSGWQVPLTLSWAAERAILLMPLIQIKDSSCKEIKMWELVIPGIGTAVRAGPHHSQACRAGRHPCVRLSGYSPTVLG